MWTVCGKKLKDTLNSKKENFLIPPKTPPLSLLHHLPSLSCLLHSIFKKVQNSPIPMSLNQEHNQKNLIDVPVEHHRYELDNYLLKDYKPNVSLTIFQLWS